MPTNATASQPLSALLRWLQANGICLSSKLRIGSVASESEAQDDFEGPIGNLGIFASSAITAGEIVSAIPKSAILSKRTTSLAGSSLFERFCQDAHEITPQTDTLILSAVVMHETLQRAASKWFGYLQSLPKAHAVDLPAFWEDSEAKLWLEGTDVYRLLQWQRSDEPSLQSFFTIAILPLFKQEHTPDLLYAIFKLAYSVVSSRAFYVDNYHGLSMVPLADVFNHHYEPQVCLQSDDVVCPACGSFGECEHDNEALSLSGSLPAPSIGDGEVVEMLATSAIEAGQEVFNTYGELGNASLLANYGFRLEANEDDRVCWFSVEEVIKDAGLDMKDYCTTEKLWRASLAREASLQTDARVVQVHEEVDHAKRPIQQLCYIDADGDVSQPLWQLLAILLGQSNDHAETGHSDLLAETMVVLCQSRLYSLRGSEMTIEELLDLAMDTNTSKQTSLAISRAVDERTLLTACCERSQG